MRVEDIFAIRLKELRLSRRWTQAQLGEYLHVNKTTICNYEKGKIIPPTEKVVEVAKVFNVTIQYLLGMSNNINMGYDGIIRKRFLEEGTDYTVDDTGQYQYDEVVKEHNLMNKEIERVEYVNAEAQGNKTVLILRFILGE